MCYESSTKNSLRILTPTLRGCTELFILCKLVSQGVSRYLEISLLWTSRKIVFLADKYHIDKRIENDSKVKLNCAYPYPERAPFILFFSLSFDQVCLKRNLITKPRLSSASIQLKSVWLHNRSQIQGWKIWGDGENILPGTFNLVNAVSQAHFVYFVMFL